jgi:hypothetical protein
MGETSEQTLLTNLRLVFTTRFSEGELRTLCFDLKVDYDSLPGEAKADKARELVAYYERRDSIHELIKVGRHNRPDIHWDDLSNGSSSNTLSERKRTPYRLFGLVALVIGGIFIIIMMLPKPSWDIQVNATPTISNMLTTTAAPTINSVSPTAIVPTAGSAAPTTNRVSPVVVVTTAGGAAPTINRVSPTAVVTTAVGAAPAIKHVSPTAVVTKPSGVAPTINHVSPTAVVPTAEENSSREVEILISASTLKDPGTLLIRDEHGSTVLVVSFTPGTQQVVKLPPGNYTYELQFERLQGEPTVNANCTNCTPIPIFPFLPSFLRGYFSLAENVSTGSVFITDFYVLYSPMNSR